MITITTTLPSADIKNYGDTLPQSEIDARVAYEQTCQLGTKITTTSEGLVHTTTIDGISRVEFDAWCSAFDAEFPGDNTAYNENVGITITIVETL